VIKNTTIQPIHSRMIWGVDDQPSIPTDQACNGCNG